MKILQIKFQGRLGNCMFQYAAARTFAESDGWTLQTPPWVGQALFVDVASEPIVGEPDRVVREGPPTGDGTVRLDGFYMARRWLPPREVSRKWFAVKPQFRVPEIPHPYTCCHLRRDDISKPGKLWPVVSWKSYLKAMTQFGINADCIVVSDNWPRGFGHQKLIEDFLIMREADFLFRGNSSFSWWAGELGNGKVFSPVLPDQPGFSDCEFVPGNQEPFTPTGERI